MALLFSLWLFFFNRISASSEFKFFVLGFHLKSEVLSTVFWPLDFGRGFSEFWASIYYLENGNGSIIHPAYLTGTGEGWRDVRIISEEKNSRNLSCYSFMEGNPLIWLMRR